MRMMTSFGALVVAAGLLSACGGGGGVSSTPTPTGTGTPVPTPTPTPTSTPTPSPTPTPTPTPGASGNATLVDLQVTQAFAGRGATSAISLDKTSGRATLQGSASNGDIEVRYDAGSQSYTVATPDRGNGAFSATERVSAQSTSVVSVYQRTGSSTTDNLLLFNPGPANTELALTYTSYGAWQTSTDNGTSVALNTTFFVFGLKTAADDMPKTGSATYAARIDGLFAGTADVYSLGGTTSLAANFGAGTIDFSMSATGTSIADGSLKDFGTLTGSGTISSATSSFTASTGMSSLAAYNASMVGTFFGPQAAEIGATFVMSGVDGTGTGAIVGKKN